jgi:hypothetical protein
MFFRRSLTTEFEIATSGDNGFWLLIIPPDKAPVTIRDGDKKFLIRKISYICGKSNQTYSFIRLEQGIWQNSKTTIQKKSFT